MNDFKNVRQINTHTHTFFNLKKEINLSIFNNMDEPGGHTLVK